MISEQNDKVYAHWTQAGYARLLNENQPVLEEVDAQVKQTSGSFNRRRYVRLLLPWRTPEGARHITLASYLKVDLTLPLISSEAERSKEHTSELQSLMRISYAVFCLKNK